VLHLLATPDVHGPVNIGAPEPVPQRDFVRTLGRVLRRPTFLHVPTPLLRVVSGEFADETVLKSMKMMPDALANSGFSFAYPHLESALRHLLGKTLATA
jgi:NAD dependent epimerase/dehydratase family enzyme